MSVPGTWTLHYDWGCTGNYSQVAITFAANGTFSIPAEGNHGKWSSHDGQILWQYDGLKTTYGGAVVDNAMVGISSTFAGLNGCWYATKATATTKTLEEHKPKHNSAGGEAK
jgi:hypothetical protein